MMDWYVRERQRRRSARRLALVAIVVGIVFYLCGLRDAPAQWQVPDHAIPIGRGAGTGFKTGGPCAAAQALVWVTGTGADPSCTTVLTTAGLGTGVATALAVNIGTAGSFVVNGGALGSPSSAGTLPAHTLGGTISGGGNQINNVIIGTSTPLAGSFTTVSATTSVTSPLDIGGAGTTGIIKTFKTTTGTGTTDAFTWVGGTNGATTFGYLSAAGLGVGTTGAPSNVIESRGDTINLMALNRNNSGTRKVGFNYQQQGTNLWGMYSDINDANVQKFTIYDYIATASRLDISATGVVSMPAAVASTSKITGTLVVTGGAGVSGAFYTDTLNIITVANASTTRALCWDNTTGLVSENGTVGTCTVSTLRAKNLVAPLTDREGFDMVMAMQPWRYDLKKGLPSYRPGEQIGFVAEYAMELDARLVAMNDDGTTAGFLYEQYTAALTAAFKYLKADNDNLRDEIETLKRRAAR